MDDFPLDLIDIDNLSLPSFLQASPVLDPSPLASHDTQSLPLITSTQGVEHLSQSSRHQALAENHLSSPTASRSVANVHPEVGTQIVTPGQSMPPTAMAPPVKARKRKAPTLSEDAWGSNKDHVIRLHIQEDLPLPKVREIMAKQYGFQAELRQYRYWISRWGLDKKVKTDEMKSIVRIRQKRKLIEVDKKEQKFVVRGQEVASGKIDRFMKNHGISQSFLYSPPSLGPTPAALDYGTVSSHATSVETPEASQGASNSAAVGRGLSPIPPSPTPSDLSSFLLESEFGGESPASLPHDLIDAGQSLDDRELDEGSTDWLDGFLAQQSAAPATATANGLRYKQECEQQLREDLQTYQFLRGPRHPDNLRIATELAEVLVEQGRYRSAGATIRQWLAVHPNRRNLADSNVIAAWNLLGRVLDLQGRSSEAKLLLERLLRFCEVGTGGVDELCKIEIMSNLASTYNNLGYRQAETFYRHVVERPSGGNRDIAKAIYDAIQLADIVSFYGSYDEGAQIAEKASLLSTETFGSIHSSTLRCKSRLSRIYLRQGKWKEAESVPLEAFRTSLGLKGSDHPDTLDAACCLAEALETLGHWQKGENLLLWLVDTSKKVLSPDHPRTLNYTFWLAICVKRQGRFEEADEITKMVIERQSSVLGLNHPHTLETALILSDIRYEQRRYKESKMLTAQLLEKCRRILGEEYSYTICCRVGMALNLSKDSSAPTNRDEATELIDQAVEAANRVLGENHPYTLRTQYFRVRIMRGEKRFKEVEVLSRGLVEKNTAILGVDHPNTIGDLELLGDALGNLGRLEEAVSTLSRCLGLQEARYGVENYESKWLRGILVFWTTKLYQGSDLGS